MRYALHLFILILGIGYHFITVAEPRGWFDDVLKKQTDNLDELLNKSWDKFDDFLNQETGELAKVVGLPPKNPLERPLEAYTGPHPSRLKRPDDSFNFPIPLGGVGPVQPLFAGPLEYPFLCGTEESGLGQPWIDNHEGIGIPIYLIDEQGQKTSQIVGYSKDCLIPTQARYYYNRVGTRDFYSLHEANNDIAKITVNGEEIDFIVRVEIGTINRFLYTIAALKSPEEILELPSKRFWNERLIYKFRGGVGIGKRQGSLNPTEALTDLFDQLRQGYAIAYSTGNRSAIHYDMWLAEDTALRVKRQFMALYGRPVYTVGIGSSGGAVEQYLLAQNNRDILDAAIAVYSFPDMVTQTIYAADCELMEYYFDVTDANNDKWHDWGNRRWIEGLNAITGFENEFAQYYALIKVLNGYEAMWPGMSECVKGWRGLTPLVHNPHTVNFFQRIERPVLEQVHWTYWDNLKNTYGVNEVGYARNTLDNVGVQYGLEAVLYGFISPEEFLDLNARIGGWKQPQDLEQEHYGVLVGEKDFDISLWSHHNMRLSPDGGSTPAPRTEGDLKAIEAAYRSGNVFIGRINIPIIDMRHYLEDELDMHHVSASFSAQSRMIREQGHAENQLIWMTRKPHSPVYEAFDLIERWMSNLINNPAVGVVGNKPADALDRCFDQEGHLIAEGANVWDGAWNAREPGPCTQVYPYFTNSRMVAGAHIAGDVFKCHLISIEEAIDRGIYIITDRKFFEPYLDRLKAIFPQGVCDYSQADQGRPLDL